VTLRTADAVSSSQDLPGKKERLDMEKKR